MRYQVQSGCLLSCWPFNKHYESHPSCQPRGFEDDVTVAVATQNGQFSFISGLHKTSLVPPTPPRAVAGIECPAVTKAGEGKPGVGWGGGADRARGRGQTPKKSSSHNLQKPNTSLQWSAAQFFLRKPLGSILKGQCINLCFRFLLIYISKLSLFLLELYEFC